MFLDVTKRRNSKLIQTGVTLHQTGEIPPNTYVIDIDILKENTKKIVDASAEHKMKLYLMSKQLGRIPELVKIIVDSGIKKVVAVDFDEGKLIAEYGIKIGNVGHLVQPGKHQWEEVLSWKPEVVTIFSFERAKQLSEKATDLGMKQDILIKVIGPKDKIFNGQEGGVNLEDLSNTLEKIQELEGISVVGVTTFPNLLLNEARTKMCPTTNFTTLMLARDILEDKGIPIKQINAPSGTSCETIPFLAEQGVTHGEPGHGLTGTTPLHAYKDLPEKPAIIYVSEVSHQYKETYQVIAGGFYGRSNMTGALVGHDPNTILDRYVITKQNSPESIDYYGGINSPKDFKVEIGDTVIYAFRTQIFVTRAHVALVEGIQSGKPRLIHLERKW
ncbi:amino-acid racemase [Paraliobacillus quinghaiensis]|uniref:Amino-acid racemase n=1 Tax=Paraliobacillus quinghaiensis TaxID=470815 RepID=A0A917WW94_9BACI|nr:YhfX family PLP-dependent enzyme [Paraliobacillus quinghaiensis]GGM38594.1 amino-acid racemase [Paraliobacillus quinghaiensis]